MRPPTQYRSATITASSISPRFMVVLLTGILSVGSSLGWLSAAIAATTTHASPLAPQAVLGQPEQATLLAQQGRRGRGRSAGSSTSNSFPASVENLVRQDLARRINVPPGRLRVTLAEPKVWNNGCLELAATNEICTQAQVPGWRVVLSAGQQAWVYHTDQTGQSLRLAVDASKADLPQAIAASVTQAAAQQLGIAATQVQIAKFAKQTWSNGCLGLATSGEFCTQAETPGWQVTVAGRSQQLVYRTNESGSVIKLDTPASGLYPAGLPKNVSRTVLQAAAQQFRVPTTQLQIVQSEKTTWPDACLGLAEPGVFCAAVIVPGWLVTVESGGQRLAYRTNDSGSLVKFDRQASNVSSATGLQPNLIGGSELIPPLTTGVIFRVVTSGGIAGQTSAIALQANGQLIQGQLQPNGVVTPVKVVQVSPAEVQRFRQLLEQQNFAQFNRHSYPAPQGAADYFTVTLSGPTVTARYADIVQNQLPAELQNVVQAWSRIAANL
ncbi:hypothetical protein [Trichocoleus sp. FACHB-262]|uniref:hypothetical protein n=1 Tax=Trichocoleus sp. FACHB-262 TaxID=2692869 RepID=UPI001688D862|nr:hypothetical protein [Trichocoleus sp. FACHB-262]MBD2122822.1 hypothetical protein [Trichocoleus sp. FACHB-262]